MINRYVVHIAHTDRLEAHKCCLPEGEAVEVTRYTGADFAPARLQRNQLKQKRRSGLTLVRNPAHLFNGETIIVIVIVILLLVVVVVALLCLRMRNSNIVPSLRRSSRQPS